jgi:hypothetical protein
MSTTMQAWRLGAYGAEGDPADAIGSHLVLDPAVPTPVAGAGQVQIKARACTRPLLSST